LPGIDNVCIAAIADTLINTLHLIRKNDDENKETESLLTNAHSLNSSDNNVSEQVKYIVCIKINIVKQIYKII